MSKSKTRKVPAFAKSLVGVEIPYYPDIPQEQTVTLGEEDIPIIEDALRKGGFKIVPIKRR